MDTIIQVLQSNPILLLFLVAGIGYPLGRIRIGGATLGVAAVLFVGLAFGALSPDLKLPEIVYTLGLVLFVYCIGLSSGAVFFNSLRRQGLKSNALVVGGIFLAGLLAAACHLIRDFKATLTAGAFAGSLTNTPALAAILEHIRAVTPPSLSEAVQSEPVIAYSLTYPMGVLGMILMIFILQKIWHVDYASEEHTAHGMGPLNEPLETCTVQVNHPFPSVAELIRRSSLNIIFGRRKRKGEVILVNGQTDLQPGDLVSLIGSKEDLDSAFHLLGTPAMERLEFDLTSYDKKRVFVSNPKIIGRRLKELNLFNQHGAIASRLRRGDLEILPRGDTSLLLGDQVQVIVPHEEMDNVVKLFGDSYRGVSEIDVLTFSLGLGLGLLLGMLPIPLPGGITLKLGIAGGPLIVALILGAQGRTGSVVWQIPYSANLALRQIGLIMFLAGVGTRSGYAFYSTLQTGNGPALFLAGTIITCVTAFTTLWVGYKVLKIPMGLLTGILAGLQTQPTVLGFAQEQTHNELPNIGYATVYPVAMITKILLAQVILILFL